MMTTKIYAAVFAVFVFLSQPAFLLGQQASDKSDWTAVQALAAGVKLNVETKDGKRFKGKLNSVSATNLNLTVNNKPFEVSKDNVRKVYQLGDGSRAKWTLIGAAVGGGVGGGGAAIAITSRGGSDEAAGFLGAGIAIGAAIGAALGYFGGKDSKKTLIYESQ